MDDETRAEIVRVATALGEAERELKKATREEDSAIDWRAECEKRVQELRAELERTTGKT
jgi:hypothetical protein